MHSPHMYALLQHVLDYDPNSMSPKSASRGKARPCGLRRRASTAREKGVGTAGSFCFARCERGSAGLVVGARQGGVGHGFAASEAVRGEVGGCLGGLLVADVEGCVGLAAEGGKGYGGGMSAFRLAGLRACKTSVEACVVC